MHKRLAASVLSPEQWRQIRYLLALSQRDWAALFGVTDRVVRSWELGEVDPPKMADRVLSAMLKDRSILSRVLDDTKLYLSLDQGGIL